MKMKEFEPPGTTHVPGTLPPVPRSANAWLSHGGCSGNRLTCHFNVEIIPGVDLIFSSGGSVQVVCQIIGWHTPRWGFTPPSRNSWIQHFSPSEDVNSIF